MNLRIALDWTPNINHIGFFIALEKGFYKEHGLNVEIVDPSKDNYNLTPAKKVELWQANFALCPTESVISYQTKKNPFELIAVAALLKEDLSAISVKKGIDIHSPKDLDGKSYSSYQARYEDAIVKEMIKNDGGKGDIRIGYPNKLGIWNSLVSGEYDSTWIFLNWEGVEAEKYEIPLQYFQMKNYGIPYSYSPLLVCDKRRLEANKKSYSNFLKATKKGFLFCKDKPEEAIELFRKYIPQKDKDINLFKALEMTKNAFGTAEDWGLIEKDTIANFVNWLKEKKLEKKELSLDNLYTNLLLK